MGTLIGVRGIGDKIWSSGIDTLAKRLHDKFGWRYGVFNWWDKGAIQDFLETANAPVVVVGHSQGVDTLDSAVEKYGKPVAAFVSVASAWPEILPDNVEKVYEVTADKDWRKWRVKGGKVNLQKTIEAWHTTIDDSEKLYILMERELTALEGAEDMLPNDIALLEEELSDWLDPEQESVFQEKFNKVFFDQIRPLFPGGLTQERVDGIKSLLWVWDKYYFPHTPLEYLAITIPNVAQETGYKMIPVRETFADSTAEAIGNLDRAWHDGKLPWVKSPYWRGGAFGRGQIQTTHHGNYMRSENLLEQEFDIEVSVSENYDLMLNPVVSALVAVAGPINGIFTGKAWSDYMMAGTGFDWFNSRSVINGDKNRILSDGTRMGEKIGDAGKAILKALEAGYAAASGTLPEKPERPPTVPETPINDSLAWIAAMTRENNRMLRELTQKDVTPSNYTSTQKIDVQQEKKPMFKDTFRWNSKTFWTGLAMVLSGLAMQFMPGSAIVVDLVGQFFGNISAGTLIANGLGLIFLREAVAKNGINK